MYEKLSTRDKTLRESAEKAHLKIDSFEKIDKVLKMLPEEEEKYMDQLLADLMQIIIQDTTSIRNAITTEYDEYFEKEIKKYADDEEVMKKMSAKYVMPEETIDFIINAG
jgi:inorganic pyrophosphatase/exopolyphosphatase